MKIDLKSTTSADKIRVMVVQLSIPEDAIKFNGEIQRYSDYFGKDYRDIIDEMIFRAIDDDINMLIFPELSIPKDYLKTIIKRVSDLNMVVVAGSNYFERGNAIFNSSPIIFKGNNHYVDKRIISEYEQGLVSDDAVINGTESKEFTNTPIGDFKVLICADIFDEEIVHETTIGMVDFVVVIACQKDYIEHHKQIDRMVVNSKKPKMAIYSNAVHSKHGNIMGSGHSALFYKCKREMKNKSIESDFVEEDILETKLFEFTEKNDWLYITVECSIPLESPKYGNSNNYCRLMHKTKHYTKSYVMEQIHTRWKKDVVKEKNNMPSSAESQNRHNKLSMLTEEERNDLLDFVKELIMNSPDGSSIRPREITEVELSEKSNMR
jgi:hypothetical protein